MAKRRQKDQDLLIASILANQLGKPSSVATSSGKSDSGEQVFVNDIVDIDDAMEVSTHGAQIISSMHKTKTSTPVTDAAVSHDQTYATNLSTIPTFSPSKDIDGAAHTNNEADDLTDVEEVNEPSHKSSIPFDSIDLSGSGQNVRPHDTTKSSVELLTSTIAPMKTDDEDSVVDVDSADNELSVQDSPTIPRKRSISSITDTESTMTSRKRTVTPASSSSSSMKDVNTLSSKKIHNIPLPTSLNDMSEADQYLYESRMSGKTFAQLTPHYLRLTGLATIGNSTLSNRFSRLQALSVTWTAAEDQLLWRCKVAIEEIFESMKWEWIKELMGRDRDPEIELGGAKWDVPSLKRRWKEIGGEDGRGERGGELDDDGGVENGDELVSDDEDEDELVSDDEDSEDEVVAEFLDDDEEVKLDGNHRYEDYEEEDVTWDDVKDPY